jgi:general secretion pathway protein N
VNATHRSAWLPRRTTARPGFGTSGFAGSTLSDRAWDRRRRAVRRWAAWGAAAGALAALAVFAPAAWLARAVDGATQGRVQLADARGTVWRGSAVLLLAGGAGSRDAASLPGRLAWALHWRGRTVDLSLDHTCCLPDGVTLRWHPGVARQTIEMLPTPSGTIGQWPAAWLAGLGTPWNTLQLGGALRLSSPGWRIEHEAGRTRFAGRLQLDLVGASSRLATIDPLGSYSVSLQGGAGDDGPSLVLTTLDGALRLSGSGQWRDGRLRFDGQAEAAPGSEAALNNLLNIIGRRQGAASLIRIG